MAVPIFYVGEQPSDPLVVTVTEADGVTPRDLTGVTSVQFVGDPLPAGTAAVALAAEGKVQYDFSAPFVEAENLRMQVKMTTGTDVDYSAPFVVSVQNEADALATIVTPVQVEAWTSVSVSQSDVVKAQGLVGLVTGRDLTDAVWLLGVNDRDLFWLQQAVAWQASEHPEGGGVSVALPYVPGASSIANGDVSISYREDSGDELSNLVANARLAIKKLSWMRPVRSVSATPFLSNRPTQPSTWVPMNRRAW
jgi:hypothetical protein